MTGNCDEKIWNVNDGCVLKTAVTLYGYETGHVNGYENDHANGHYELAMQKFLNE